MEESFAVVNEAGLTIRGVILRPKPRGKFPLVAVAGDFFDTRDSPSVKEASRLFLDAGYAVLLFDFTNGFGESDGRPSDITMSQRARDIADAVNYAKRRAYINERKTAVFGLGFGAMAALILEAFHPTVAALALVNTPNAIDGTAWTKFDEREMMRIKLKRYFHVKHDEQEVLFNYTFFEDGMKIDMSRCARNLQTPTLFIAGAEDNVVPNEQSAWFFENVPAKKAFALLQIGNITGRKGVKAAVDESIQFLKKQL